MLQARLPLRTAATVLMRSPPRQLVVRRRRPRCLCLPLPRLPRTSAVELAKVAGAAGVEATGMELVDKARGTVARRGGVGALAGGGRGAGTRARGTSEDGQRGARRLRTARSRNMYT